MAVEALLSAPAHSIEVEWVSHDGWPRKVRLICGDTVLIEFDEDDARRIGGALVDAANHIR